MISEVWKRLDFDPRIEVSSHGSVRKNSKVCKYYCRKGYLFVSVKKKQGHENQSVHRLVALTFLGNPPSKKHQVAHLDGNSKNNNISNLMWATPQENSDHKFIHGTYAHGERHGMSKITEDIARDIYSDDSGSCSELGHKYGVSRATIGLIKVGKIWKHLKLTEGVFRLHPRDLSRIREDLIIEFCLSKVKRHTDILDFILANGPSITTGAISYKLKKLISEGRMKRVGGKYKTVSAEFAR